MEFLTVKETAQLLRVSPITVRRYIASGKLAAERVGRGIRVRREAIEGFLSPVMPGADRWNANEEEPPPLREQLGNVSGIGRSREPTNTSDHKDEYIGDAIADWDEDNEDEEVVEVVSPSSPGGVELVPEQVLGKPFSKDDPLWEIVGIGRSEGSNDVASNKHKYIADAIFADKFGKE